MATSNKKSRRQFLRNTALTALAVTAIPEIAKSGVTEVKDAASCDPTTLDFYGQGPFYTAGAPVLVNNQLASLSETGERLIISGVVRTLDCSAVVPDATIDIWHANNAGGYDTVGFNLRGVAKSNAQGFYLFETIKPGKYLNGSSYRPSHIHFKITPPGFPTLITQLYFEGDTDIPGDAAASIQTGTYNATHRIIPIAKNLSNVYEGTWDIVVNGGATGVIDLHLEKGVIYSVSPNPFTSEVEIHYGVFTSSKVSIHIFNMTGSLVAVLDERNINPQKYYATWKPESSLPLGVYWVALKVNDLLVNYQKVVKM